jgi:arylsulfatase A-like enzyme
MGKYLFTLIFIIALSLPAFNQNIDNKPSDKKPNIIIIMADDMGYSDIGCYGSEIQTPNLDKLADEGVRLTHFYNAARCCPSRASLLTGLYPHQTGIGEMMRDEGLPGYRGFLNQSSVTLAEVLSEGGYHTMISGKWHLGKQENAWPMKRGFDKQYGSSVSTGHYFGVASNRDYVVEDSLMELPGEWITAGKIKYKLLKNDDGSQWYATDAYTDRAIGYIKELRDKDKEKPFFLYLPYSAPHWPLHAFEEDIQKYEGTYMAGWDSVREARYKRLIELGIIKDKWLLSKRNELSKDWDKLDEQSKKHYDRMMAVYAAMVDRMDQNIGRLIAALKESNDQDNTIILFFSDNGGSHEPSGKGKEGASIGSPDSYKGYEYSWANVSNTPFRWFKHWTHEGGNSSPFIAWYPKMIKAGEIDHQVAHISDIMATVCELSGTDYPTEYNGHQITPTEGLSMVPIFKGEIREEHEYLCWEHQGNRAVRKGDWKIVSRFKELDEGQWELYNIKEDRSEMNDLSEMYPEKIKAMEQLYKDWALRINVVPFKDLKKTRKKKLK